MLSTSLDRPARQGPGDAVGTLRRLLDLALRCRRWLQDNLPDPHRLDLRDWCVLAVFSLYKSVCVAAVVIVWNRLWTVLPQQYGEVALLLFCLAVFPSLVHYWRPALYCWRKATEPAQAARLQVRRWDESRQRAA